MLVFTLMLIGFLLMLAEVTVIPGFGVAGVTGILLMVSGMVTAYYTLGTIYAVIAIVCGLAISSAATVYAVFIFPKSKAAKKLSLETNHIQENSIAVNSHSELIGLEGVTTSILRPSGKARIADEIYDVVADAGAYIEKDAKIVVKNATFGKITVVLKQS